MSQRNTKPWYEKYIESSSLVYYYAFLPNPIKGYMLHVIRNSFYSLTLFVSIFFPASNATAQIRFPSAQEEYKQSEPAIIFHPYYNDVQLIEIDNLGRWNDEVNHYEMTRPRALEWSSVLPPPAPNVYLFRHRNGTIVKAFNTKSSLVELTRKYGKLKPAELPKGAIPLPASFRRELIYRFTLLHEYIFDGFFKIYSMQSAPAKRTGGNWPDITTQQGDLMGLIDTLGNIILPVEYDGLWPLKGDVLAVKDSLYGVITKEGKDIVPMIYESAEHLRNDRVAFYQQKKIRLVYDPEEKRSYSPKEYDYARLESYEFHNDPENRTTAGYYSVRKDGKFGFIDASYREVLPPVYDYCEPVFHNGLTRVCRDKKWGFIDTTCREVIPCVYEDATDFYMGLARVVLDGEVQCINTNAELSGPCNRSWEEWKAEDKKLPDGRLVVTRSQLRGLVNGSGRIVLPIIYDHIQMIESGIKQFDYLEGYYLVQRFKLYGVIKKNGTEVMPIAYDHIRNFHHSTGVAEVERDGKQGLIDRSFKLVIPCEYEALSSPLIPGFVAFRQNGLWGWMDYAGKVAVVPQFDQIGWMYDGRMRVEKGKKFGIVDINGREVIPIKYESIEDRFYNGYIRAILNKKYGYLDSTGAVVIPFEYEEVRNFEKPIAGAQKGKFYGFIDRQGKEVVPFIYDFVDHSWYSDGFVKVIRKGKIGYVDATGKEVIPCIYDEETGFNPSKGRHVRLKHEWIWVK